MRSGTCLKITSVLLTATCMGAGAFAQTLSVPPGLALNVTATNPAALVHSGDAPVSSSNEATLPDSPSFVLAGDTSAEGQTGHDGAATSGAQIAPRYAVRILPGQSSQPLSGGQKVVYAFRDAVSPLTLLSIVVSAGYSQGVSSAPHYIDNSFAKRLGAAAARNTLQTLAGEAVFAPLFHDDPRYYVLGRQHKFINRVAYAATRVVVTRSDAGQSRVNAPLLLGYGVAAGVNNIYYPQQDRGGKDTAISYVSSLGGAVLGLEVYEFLDDALRIVHLRHD